jgi:hypothetical protein
MNVHFRCGPHLHNAEHNSFRLGHFSPELHNPTAQKLAYDKARIHFGWMSKVIISNISKNYIWNTDENVHVDTDDLFNDIQANDYRVINCKVLVEMNTKEFDTDQPKFSERFSHRESLKKWIFDHRRIVSGRAFDFLCINVIRPWKINPHQHGYNYLGRSTQSLKQKANAIVIRTRILSTRWLLWLLTLLPFTFKDSVLTSPSGSKRCLGHIADNSGHANLVLTWKPLDPNKGNIFYKTMDCLFHDDMLKFHITTSGGMDTAEHDLIRSGVFDNCIIDDGGVIKQPSGDASTKEKGETQSSENMLLALDEIFGRWL